MKNIKIYALLLLFLSFGLKAVAASDINLSGELDVAFTLKHLPTRDQGVTAFNIPALKLDIEAPLRDGNGLFFQLESSEFRDGTSQRFDTQLKEAYLRLTSFLPPRSELRYGLIPDVYVQMARELWDYDFWGPASQLPLVKYGYTDWADLGVMYQGDFGDDWGQWALSVTNGEGNRSDETSQRKQAQLVVDLSKANPLNAMLSYTYGSYDAYDSRFNKKTRLAANVSYNFSSGYLALEYFATQDPADVITLKTIAAGVDVVAQGGTTVDGEGAALFGQWDMSEKTDLLLRLDWLSPVKQERDKNLKSVVAGISYDPNEDVRWLLAAHYTDYSEEFLASIRDEGQLVLATRVSF